MGFTHAWGLALSDPIYYGNHDVMTSLGSVSGESSTKTMLSRDWGIRNKKELLSSIEKLKNATAISFSNPSKAFKRIQCELSDEERENIDSYGLAGWDLARHSLLVRSGHRLNLLTTTQAWELLNQQRQDAQQHFPGWESYAENFRLGSYNLYSDDGTRWLNRADRACRLLTRHPFSRWLSIDWNTQDVSIPSVQDEKDYNPFNIDSDESNKISLELAIELFQQRCLA